MFAGPSAGGLRPGPTAGARYNTNPASYIPNDGLAIAQVSELRGELSLKHPLLTATSTLPQALVTNLTSDLAARATAQQLTDSIATRQPVVQDGSLTIARTSGLQAAWDEKARASDVATALAAKQPLIQDGSLTIARTSGLQAAQIGRAHV